MSWGVLRGVLGYPGVSWGNQTDPLTVPLTGDVSLQAYEGDQL